MMSSGPDEYDYEDEGEESEGEENPRAKAARKILDTEFQVAEMTEPEDINNYIRSRTPYEDGE